MRCRPRTRCRCSRSGQRPGELQPLRRDHLAVICVHVVQRQVPKEMPHLPIRSVARVEPLGEDGGVVMLSTSGSDQVMTKASRCELHAQKQMGVPVHVFLRDTLSSLDRSFCSFLRPMHPRLPTRRRGT